MCRRENKNKNTSTNPKERGPRLYKNWESTDQVFYVAKDQENEKEKRGGKQGVQRRNLSHSLFSLIRLVHLSFSLSLSLSLIIIQHKTEKKCSKKPLLYLSGMNLDDVVDPIPALPCLTGLYEIENSPR